MLKSQNSAITYDEIIVGGGSAGAVMASRLSEDPERNILLIEAGNDYKEIADTPKELLDPGLPVLRGHNWELDAFVQEPDLVGTLKSVKDAFIASDNSSRVSMTKTALSSYLKGESVLTRFMFPVGKVTGGSSAINGALALRGAPEDYNEWCWPDNDFWHWSKVKSLFQSIENKSESALDATNSYYRKLTSPFPVNYFQERNFGPVHQSFVDTCRSFGFSEGDPNKTGTTGFSGLPRNVNQGKRISTARAYLAPVRERENLHVLSNTLVNKVIFHNQQAIGVEVIRDGKTEVINAGRIILCAGAIHSPTILLRSGVGPTSLLSELKIPLQMALEGVGKNLSDHSSIAFWMIPKENCCRPGEDIHQTILRYTTEDSDISNDMHLYMLGSVPTALYPELKIALGVPYAIALTAMLAKPMSRGHLILADKNPTSAPKIYMNYASHPDDRRRLKDGAKLAWQFINHSSLGQHVKKVFAWNNKILSSDKLLSNTINTFVRGSWHVVGSARMGQAKDPMSVVNQYGEVYGCEGLVVADASIMPTVPKAPTGLSTIMVAENIAQHLRKTKENIQEEKCQSSYVNV